MHIYGAYFMYPYKQSGRWQNVINTKKLKKNYQKTYKVYFVT